MDLKKIDTFYYEQHRKHHLLYTGIPWQVGSDQTDEHNLLGIFLNIEYEDLSIEEVLRKFKAQLDRYQPTFDPEQLQLTSYTKNDKAIGVVEAKLTREQFDWLIENIPGYADDNGKLLFRPQWDRLTAPAYEEHCRAFISVKYKGDYTRTVTQVLTALRATAKLLETNQEIKLWNSLQPARTNSQNLITTT